MKIQKAIDTLATEWLGKYNVVSIHDEQRQISKDKKELCIVMKVTKMPTIAEHIAMEKMYPSDWHGYTVCLEEGLPIEVENER